MKILVTGSDGFIAQNLIETLIKNPSLSLLTHNRGGTKSGLLEKLEEADFLFHLAGVNRSSDESEFVRVNVDLTEVIASYLKSTDHPIPIVFSSSIQSGRETIYGKTKLEAELILTEYAKDVGDVVRIYRLPNVFGKWSKPDYNSAVATFCFRVANDLEISVPNPASPLMLVYVDDVVESFVGDLDQKATSGIVGEVRPIYETTVGNVCEIIKNFKNRKENNENKKQQDYLIENLEKTYFYFLKDRKIS